MSNSRTRREAPHSISTMAEAKTRSFYATKNGGIKPNAKAQHVQVLINAKTKITDPQFDVFAGYHEFPEHTDFVSSQSAAEALKFKKKNRQRMMQARRDRLLKQLQNQNLTDNLIPPQAQKKKKELNRHKSNSPIKRREGSNLKKPPANQLSPMNNNVDYSKRNSNNGAKATSSQVGKREPISQNSQFTLSSARKEEVEIDSNSIISEEDSAFEDFSPRNNRRGKKRIENNKKQMTNDNQMPTRLQGPMANEIISGNKTFRNTDKLDIYVEPPSQEELQVQPKISKKNEHRRPSKTQNLFPLKRSTTQKNREQDIEAQTSLKKRSKYLEERERDKSRDSSFNMMSDNHYDQLSINVGNHALGNYNAHRKFVKQANATSRKFISNNMESGLDSNSVVSVITGTKQYNYFGGAKKSSEGDFQKAKQTSNSSHVNNELDKVIAQSKDIDAESGRFPSFRRQRKRNEKIVNVYLQTPYKVNSYAEIKSSLYRAENNLKVHTALRNKQAIEAPKQVIEIEKVDHNLTQNFTTISKTNRNNNKSEEFGSLISEGQDKGSSHRTQIGQESITQTRSFMNTKDKFLNPAQRKIIKDRIQQQESSKKQSFFEQLNQKLDRKIELLNHQGRHLTKQNQLFYIYGPKENNWFNPRSTHHKTLMNEMLGSSIAFSQENNTTPTPNPNQHEMADVEEQRCGTSTIEKEISKVNPYLPESLKSRKIAIREIEACVNTQPHKRNSQFRKNLITKPKPQNPINVEENENLQELIDKAKDMGLSKVQMNEILAKQSILEEAERQLEKQIWQVKSGLNTSVNFNTDLPKDIDYLPSTLKDSSIQLTVAEIRKSQEQASMKQKQLQSKSINEENQRILKSVGKKGMDLTLSGSKQTSRDKKQQRSIDHQIEVKDYFENKMDLKRNILRQEQKNLAQLSSIKKKMDQNMFAAVSDEKKKLRIKFITDSKSKSTQKTKRSNEKHQTNFIKNNIMNTVLPQILNQYNNGSETRRFELFNTTSDNECEPILIGQQKPLLNMTIMAESRVVDQKQRLSYNSNILSQSSAEMISNLPLNSARLQTNQQKQSPQPAYKKSNTINESPKKNQKLRPYEGGGDSIKTKTRLVVDSPSQASKNCFPQQPLTSIEKQNQMLEIYNIPNMGKPALNQNYQTSKHGKIQLDRTKIEWDQCRAQTKRNVSIDRQQKSNYANFYSDKFVNSEQTAILKTCFDNKKELQKMLSGIQNFKQAKRLPQIPNASSVTYAPTQ